MTDQTFRSVWHAIEDTTAGAETMRLKSQLMLVLRQHIDTSGLTADEAARRLDVTAPRLNELQRGQISRFSVEALVAMASAAGLRIELSVHSPEQRGHLT